MSGDTFPGDISIQTRMSATVRSFFATSVCIRVQHACICRVSWVSFSWDLTAEGTTGVFQGSSTLLLGCGANDTGGGRQVDLSAGDVIVLPAGTAHCNLESTTDYRYIGVYPKVCCV